MAKKLEKEVISNMYEWHKENLIQLTQRKGRETNQKGSPEIDLHGEGQIRVNHIWEGVGRIL